MIPSARQPLTRQSPTDITKSMLENVVSSTAVSSCRSHRHLYITDSSVSRRMALPCAPTPAISGSSAESSSSLLKVRFPILVLAISRQGLHLSAYELHADLAAPFSRLADDDEEIKCTYASRMNSTRSHSEVNIIRSAFFYAN